MSNRRRQSIFGLAALALSGMTIASSAGAGVILRPSDGTPPPSSLTRPRIIGTAVAGQPLAATPGTWSGKNVSFVYVWQRCNAAGAACVDQRNQGSHHTLSARLAQAAQHKLRSPIRALSSADIGRTFRVVVYARNKYGASQAVSRPTGVVAPAPATPPSTAPQAPSALTLPTISGSATFGQILIGSPGKWSGTAPLTNTYQWLRCTVTGSSCAAVAGATALIYTLGAADVGTTLRFQVQTTNSAGSKTAQSNATAVVAPLAGPTSPVPPIVPTTPPTTSTPPGGPPVVTSTPAPAPPPAPAPSPSPSGVMVGVTANVAGYGAPRQQLVLSMGAKLIREDRGDYAVSWAHSHGINCIGLIYLNPDSPGTGCDEIELDNEPYWQGVDPRVWAQQADSVAKTLRSRGITKPLLLPLLAFASNKALGSGFDGNGNYTYQGVTKPWVEWVNEGAPDIWQYVDGFAIHPYTGGIAPSYQSMNTVRSELDAIPAAKGKPFWITEVGWPTGPSTQLDPAGWATTEANQAAWLGQFIDAMKARTDVAAVVVYQLVDINTSDTTTSEDHYGLLQSDGTPKPAYAVVQQRLG